MSTQKKMRILWLSDSPTVNSGFGVVAKNLIDNICKIMGDSIEIVVVGINIFESEPIQYNKQTLVIDGRLDRLGITDTFCRGTFIDILKNDPDGYDGVFILQDFAIFNTIVDAMREIQNEKKKLNKKAFKSFLYVPVDGYIREGLLSKIMPDGKKQSIINFFDVIVTYNEYGKEMISNKKPELKSKIKIIPHGCNKKDFYKISNEEIRPFREEFFKDNADKLIFINVNRNQPRKAIEDTILAFQEAKNNWTLERKPFLYLNMGRIDPMGHNLDTVFEQTNLVEGEDYMIAPEEFWTKKWGVDTSILNQIYNAADIYVTTTLGEGWGLSVTEAMAVMLPVICPYHTSLMEISGHGKRAYLLQNLYPSCSSSDNVIRERVDIYETAEVMITAATNRIAETDIDMVERAYAYVKTLDWNKIAHQFVKYFEETYK